MTVPTITQETIPIVVGVSYLTFIVSLPPGVVLGSFAGAVVFLMGKCITSKCLTATYFIVAFLAGLLGAAPVAEISEGILALLRISVTIPHGLGALISAAVTLNVIGWFRDNPSFFMLRKSGGKS